MVPADLGGESGEVGTEIVSDHQEDVGLDAEPVPVEDNELADPESNQEGTSTGTEGVPKVPIEIPPSQPDLDFPWDYEMEEEAPTEEEQGEYEKYTPEDKALPLEPQPQPKSKNKGWKDHTPSHLKSNSSDSLQLKLAKKALAKLKKKQEDLILSCGRIPVFFSQLAGVCSISRLVGISTCTLIFLS